MPQFLRKKFGGFIDSLAWLSMHAIARRQESKIHAHFPQEISNLPVDPAILFPAPAAPNHAAVRNTNWKKRDNYWRRDFVFPSALRSPYSMNDSVFVRVFAPQKDGQRPAVILLHGLMNVSLVAYRPFIKAILASGAAAYALELPYHHRRKPPGSISGDLFHTANLETTFAAVQQAVSDVRQLIRFLHQTGAPQTGLLGFSLGAWIGALAACSEPELDFAFLGMPPNHLNELVWHSTLGAQLCRRFVAQGWDEKFTAPFYDKLDPIRFQPLLPPENLQLYAAKFDSLIALEHVHALRHAWAMPALRLYPDGHLTIMISRQLHRDFRQDLQNMLVYCKATPASK